MLALLGALLGAREGQIRGQEGQLGQDMAQVGPKRAHQLLFSQEAPQKGPKTASKGVIKAT